MYYKMNFENKFENNFKPDENYVDNNFLIHIMYIIIP
jgi:hypothetical protein